MYTYDWRREMGKYMYIKMFATFICVCLLVIPQAYAGGFNIPPSGGVLLDAPKNLDFSPINIPSMIVTNTILTPQDDDDDMVFSNLFDGLPVFEFKKEVLINMPPGYYRKTILLRIKGLDYIDIEAPGITQKVPNDVLVKVVYEE